MKWARDEAAPGAAPPTPRVLRVACDWAKLLYDYASPWDRLRGEGWPEAQAITVDGESLGLARGALDPEQEGTAVYSGHGVRVLMRRADEADRSKGKYAVELDVQGSACSTSRDGLSAVESIRKAVESWLWKGADVSAATFPGKLDVCVDVEIDAPTPSEGSAWIEENIFKRGRIDEACGVFSTRMSQRKRQMHGARAPDEHPDEVPAEGLRMLGSSAKGRTLYMGADPRIMVYEKDRDPGKDVAAVKERWKEAGWNESSRVIRIEASVTRTWLGKNAVLDPQAMLMAIEDGLNEREAGELVDRAAQHIGGPAGMVWADARRWIPAIGAAVLGRTRMKVSKGSKHVKRRADAPVWLHALAALDEWTHELARLDGATCLAEWRGVGEIVARARAYSKERATKRLETAVAELLVHDAQDCENIRPSEVALARTQAMERGEGVRNTDELDKRARRVATKLSLRAPPSVVRPRVRAHVSLEGPAPSRGAAQGERAVAELRALTRMMELDSDLDEPATWAVYDALKSALARVVGDG